MNALLKSIVKKTLIAFMLLSFSLYASSVQLDNAVFESNISIDAHSVVSHTNTAMNSEDIINPHCKNASSQHCNNCAQCVVIGLSQQFIHYEPLYIANRDLKLNTEKRIEIPFKPPRNE